jgi:hypothetical protein
MLLRAMTRVSPRDINSTPHIKADEFGNDAFYGYGIAVDRLDGHLRLRHTGGMVSFASALEVDLDDGVGVFASVNAMQGLRPRPVAEYALRLMRACRSSAPLPEIPPPANALRVARAADYAGRYTGAAGRALDIRAEADRLVLLQDNQRIGLEPAVDTADAFHVAHPDFARYLLIFTRADPNDPTSPVIDAAHAESAFARESFKAPAEPALPAEWRGYAGHYRNEDPWLGSHRVVARHGRLWLDGVIPLEPARGRTMRLVLSGADFVRVMTA